MTFEVGQKIKWEAADSWQTGRLASGTVVRVYGGSQLLVARDGRASDQPVTCFVTKYTVKES